MPSTLYALAREILKHADTRRERDAAIRSMEQWRDRATKAEQTVNRIEAMIREERSWGAAWVVKVEAALYPLTRDPK